MMEREFSSDLERDLIKLVKPEEFLYVKKHANYRNQFAKDTKWREISQKLGVSGAKCRAKWKSMRDQYSRELKRLKMFPEKIIAPKWKHYEALEFLRQYIRPRSSLEKSEFNYTDEETCKTVNWGMEFVEYDKSRPAEPQSPEEPQQFSAMPATSSISRNFQMVENDETHSRMPQKHVVAEASDEIDAFFTSVAMKVRNANLSSVEFIDMQIDILRVINEKFKTCQQ